MSISKDVQKYALIISKTTGVDVEVVDENLYRIAGTGVYEKNILEDMSSKGYVYKHVLKSGKTQIVHNPGEDELCKACPDRSNCIESFEISTPIILKSKVVGVIGLITSDNRVKKVLEEKLTNYLDLLGIISDFIAAKLFESDEESRKINLINTLNLLINSMEQGAIIINNRNKIITINRSAYKQLQTDKNLVEKEIRIVETGDTLNNSKEYELKIEDKHVTIIGEVKKLNNNDDYYKMIIFSNITKIHSSIYSLTAMQNAGDIIGVSDSIVQLKAEY